MVNLELLGRMATEPLRSLNTGSAKATTWAVRILHPKQDSFSYGREKQSTMHTFDCLLVSDDPAVYCGGALKSPKEQDIKAAMEKLKAKILLEDVQGGFRYAGEACFHVAPP